MTRLHFVNLMYTCALTCTVRKFNMTRALNQRYTSQHCMVSLSLLSLSLSLSLFLSHSLSHSLTLINNYVSIYIYKCMHNQKLTLVFLCEQLNWL